MADLISRAAAIARIDKCVALSGIGLEPVMAVRDIKALISVLPAVDAVPVVHGNWIECYERSRHYYCSNCGKVQGIASIVMKYCPECGAKMAQHPWAGRYADQSGAVQDGGEDVIETLKNIAPMVCRYIMAAWLGWYVMSELTQHGEVEERTHDAGAAFFGCFFMVMLLAGGGFWG